MSSSTILESFSCQVQSNPKEKSIVASSQGGLGIGRGMYSFVLSMNGSFASESPSSLISSYPSLNSLSGRGVNLISITSFTKVQVLA